MSANCVLPPFDGMLRACSSEYFAGVTLNELSECHRRLPMANSRRRSSRANGVLFLSRLETSAKVVGRRASLAARRLVPMACSMSPRLWVKASCWASSIFWSRNTSTAYLSMPAWIAATSSRRQRLAHVDAVDFAREAGPDLADGDGHRCLL